jgi:hypothetical protein
MQTVAQLTAHLSWLAGLGWQAGLPGAGVRWLRMPCIACDASRSKPHQPQSFSVAWRMAVQEGWEL